MNNTAIDTDSAAADLAVKQLTEQATGTASDNRSDSRRNLILAAAKLFREKGYQKTTVRDLAAAVGMQSGSLFYHFKNKEEILCEVMYEGVDNVSKHVGAAAERDYANARDRLVAMSVAHLEVLLGADSASLAVMLYEWQNLPEALRRKIVILRNGYEAQWHIAFNQARDAGLWKGDERLTARLFLGGLNWMTQWYSESGPLSVPDISARIVDQLLIN